MSTNDVLLSCLDIEVMAWFETRDWGEFQAMRQEILLAFMQAIEEAGTSIAFPTRTIIFPAGDAGGIGRSAIRADRARVDDDV